jgi:hypothetical protein
MGADVEPLGYNPLLDADGVSAITQNARSRVDETHLDCSLVRSQFSVRATSRETL